MWERAEETGGSLHVLCGEQRAPPPCGTHGRGAGPPQAHVLCGGRGVCDSRDMGMGLRRTLCSFCNYSCGVCLQRVWPPDLQCFHVAKSLRCLQIPDSPPDNQLANQRNSLWEAEPNTGRLGGHQPMAPTGSPGLAECQCHLSFVSVLGTRPNVLRVSPTWASLQPLLGGW